MTIGKLAVKLAVRIYGPTPERHSKNLDQQKRKRPVDVTAFEGYRYDKKIVGDNGTCIAPPYDVIDPDQQQELYDRNQYNIVRVIKGAAKDSDNENDNVYTRAAEALKEFVRSGGLKKDDQKTIYAYAQDFTGSDNKKYRRSGFIALGKLQEYGNAIKPHEQTLAAPRADRLNLMRATKTQTGQIFMLYSDPSKTIDKILEMATKTEPLLEHIDHDNVEHRLFAVTETSQIGAIVNCMKDKSVCIADGHHRYETALNYYNETKSPAAAHHMMTFINTHNEGLVVLPTHRLLKNVEKFEIAWFVSTLAEQFDVARLAFEDENEKQEKQQMTFDALKLEEQQNKNAFGMYFADGAFYVATLKDENAMAQAAPEHSDAWRKLDVAVLHKLMLEKILGIDEKRLAAQTNVDYVKDLGDAVAKAIEKVDSGKYQGLFLLNATKAQEVEAVAATGEKMPQKSTFFHPKIFSGLTLNVLEQ